VLTAEENRLLTEVEGAAPMGQWMRENHWIPCARSAQLEPGGKPERIRLLGENFVAFRTQDGTLGFVDEACPHRRASLALARNEDGALTCIFHGWRVAPNGCVLDAPSELRNTKDFAAKVPFRTYPTFEGGGLIWVWLGKAAPTARPNSPFVFLPADQVWISRTVTPCNWLQGVEGTLDSLHIGTLHKSWIERIAKLEGKKTIGKTIDNTPWYEVEGTPYGLRAAALRRSQEGAVYVRVSEYIMPFVTLVAGQGKEFGVIFIAVPIDNVSHLLFFGIYHLEQAMGDAQMERHLGYPASVADRENFATLDAGPERYWGQNRAAMADGHFTGFDRNILVEDVVVQASMGPVVDRTKEFLSASDIAVAQARRRLLEALRGAERSDVEGAAAVDARSFFPLDTLLPPGGDWRHFSFWREAAE
jgi:nitrite reductase/ring-hydroxylating ferredoxin subunit